MIQSKIQTVTHDIWLIIIRKSFRGDILYCLIELFFLSVILALILKKTEDNSLFGVKLLIHHWTSNLHDADYESTTMKARIQIWSEERGQLKVKQGQINQRILSRFLFHGLNSPSRVGKNLFQLYRVVVLASLMLVMKTTVMLVTWWCWQF